MAQMPIHKFVQSEYGQHCKLCGYEQKNLIHDELVLATLAKMQHTDPMPKANDIQVGGSHYKGKKYEHWDIVIEHELDYFQGQITKYVMRWRGKNGLQDLEKAQHFLQKYIESERAKLPHVQPTGAAGVREHYRVEPALKEDSNG